MRKLNKLIMDNNPLLAPEDVATNLEDKVPPPPLVGDCSLTRQKYDFPPTLAVCHMEAYNDKLGFKPV